jgi:hypothetical protein
VLEEKIYYFVYNNISTQDTLFHAISEELQFNFGEDSEIFE